MVSKARLDLPEPDSPVTTISLSRGSSRETFLRLCTRAPCTAMVVRAAARAERAVRSTVRPTVRLGPTAASVDVEEGQLLDGGVAPAGELDGGAGLAGQPQLGQVLARRGHPLHPPVAGEVIVDLGRRPGLPHLAQVIEH